MLNGTATQAGLTQLINERRQADQGTGTDGASRGLFATADDDGDQHCRGRLCIRAEAVVGPVHR